MCRKHVNEIRERDNSDFRYERNRCYVIWLSETNMPAEVLVTFGFGEYTFKIKLNIEKKDTC